ncbi:hypothetical protein BSKO_13940 [Bryopsis sp. KO-2023]|nr:hypothetical protein BSKO_13940 [Bryopsis sp. KO-2023]
MFLRHFESRGQSMYGASIRAWFLACWAVFVILSKNTELEEYQNHKLNTRAVLPVRGSRVNSLRDKYPNYAALSTHEIKWTPKHPVGDYRILVDDMPESKCLVMAIHGGGIEPYTSNLAGAYVGTCKVYRFEGMKRRGNKDLHITSNHFDEPTALDMVQTATTCVSLHGMSGPDKNVICLGGRNQHLKERFMDAAREYPLLPFEVHQCDYPMCASFCGSSKRNIVNKCSSEGGLQLEISRRLRDEMKASPGQTLAEKAIMHLIKVV